MGVFFVQIRPSAVAFRSGPVTELSWQLTAGPAAELGAIAQTRHTSSESEARSTAGCAVRAPRTLFLFFSWIAPENEQTTDVAMARRSFPVEAREACRFQRTSWAEAWSCCPAFSLGEVNF